MALDFWYDGQLRRYWLQFIRIFQGFQYQAGIRDDGTVIYKTIPVRYASKDRMVNHIIRDNSENKAISLPQMACEMVEIKQNADRRQNTNHVSKAFVWEREFDPVEGKYTSEPGMRYEIDRYMPVPYDMTMQMTLWTSNEMQKNQIMEQILVLFNPSIDIQTSDNPIDWSALTIVELVDITWSNRSQPIGTEDDIEVTTITFNVPIWLNPPAKIKKQTIINQIITNINQFNDLDVQTLESGQYAYPFNFDDVLSQTIVSPKNIHTELKIIVNNDGSKAYELYALNDRGEPLVDGKPISWRDIITIYGDYREGVSRIRLKTSDDIEDFNSDIVGTFSFDPERENVVFLNIDEDTMPANTIPPITGIVKIDGRVPGRNLPHAEVGQRYIITDDLYPDPAWSNISANINDIIEFDGSKWFVAFDANETSKTHYVYNMRSRRQLKWQHGTWVLAHEKIYAPGFWRLIL